MSDYETMCFGDFEENYITANGGSEGVDIITEYDDEGTKIVSLTVVDKDVDEDGLDALGRPYLSYFRLLQPSEELTPDTMGEMEML